MTLAAVLPDPDSVAEVVNCYSFLAVVVAVRRLPVWLTAVMMVEH